MQKDFTRHGPLIWLSQTSANASNVCYSVQLDALIGRLGDGNSADYTREAHSVSVDSYASINNDMETCRADTIESIIEEVLDMPLLAGD